MGGLTGLRSSALYCHVDFFSVSLRMNHYFVRLKVKGTWIACRLTTPHPLGGSRMPALIIAAANLETTSTSGPLDTLVVGL